MKSALNELVELLRVERLEDRLFRGLSGDVGSPNVFGGQVLGQALMAAALTVDRSRSVHSLHAYFLRPGDKRAPIVYDVECIRDGGSFTTRRVVAVQHGEPIFNFAASFHAAEPGFEHLAAMPQVEPPDRLPGQREVWRGAGERLGPAVRAWLEAEQAIEFRPIEEFSIADAPPQRPPRFDAWMRAADRLPDEPVLHQAMLAYASDFGLLRPALLPHRTHLFDRRLQVASLDHAMWFHGDFRLDDWLLYSTESPFAGGARGFCRGSIYRADGRLVASTAQEGLMRMRRPRPDGAVTGPATG